MIQGFEDYSTEQIEGIVLEHISGIFNDNGIDVEIYGFENQRRSEGGFRSRCQSKIQGRRKRLRPIQYLK